MSNGQTNHRAVRQIDGTLNQSFTKGTTSHNHPSIVILNGTRHDFSSRGSIAVNQYDDLAFFKQAATFGFILHTLYGTSFSIDDKFILMQ